MAGFPPSSSEGIAVATGTDEVVARRTSEVPSKHDFLLTELEMTAGHGVDSRAL
jgi:hypothetical protein